MLVYVSIEPMVTWGSPIFREAVFVGNGWSTTGGDGILFSDKLMCRIFMNIWSGLPAQHSAPVGFVEFVDVAKRGATHLSPCWKSIPGFTSEAAEWTVAGKSNNVFELQAVKSLSSIMKFGSKSHGTVDEDDGLSLKLTNMSWPLAS